MRLQVSDATDGASLRDRLDYGQQCLWEAQSTDSKLDSNVTLGGRPRVLPGRWIGDSDYRME